MIRLTYCALAWSLVLASCGGSAPFSPGAPLAQGSLSLTSSRWIPTAGESYQIQYDGKLDLSVDAQIYDLDMFDTKASVVSTLHGMGRKVMCYISVGTWENWRPDAKEFPKSVLGHKDGHWKGERWLDVRQTSVLEPIMAARLALCKKKGFDGVDPDNLDGYQNRTGFPLTYAEQLTYDTWVAQQAHADGLTADQKGDNGQVKDLVKVYDFAVVEQCFTQGWCKQFTRYTDQNRLVVDVEYFANEQRFLTKTCPSDAKYDETAILKKLELTAWIVTCSSGSFGHER
jgi:hypothetical protein